MEEVMIKYDKVLSHLSEAKRYRQSFQKSIEGELYDYSILTVWKTFMLILYEKLYQIGMIKGDLYIPDEWKKKYGSTPKCYKLNNLYWPNEEDDGKIIQFLDRIYDIDSNFIKLLAVQKKSRDISSHVSEIEFNKNDVSDFLDKISLILDKIQSSHDSKYLTDIELIEKLDLKPSNYDIRRIIDLLIVSLRNSGSFAHTNATERKILSFKRYLTAEDFENIFNAIFENPGTYFNQVLSASYTDTFIKTLYDLEYLSKEDWKKKFVDRLVTYFIPELEKMSDYDWLFKELGLSSAKKMEEDLWAEIHAEAIEQFEKEDK